MQDLTYMGAARVILRFRLPLAEVITDFYDRLKSATAGFASFDYEDAGYQVGASMIGGLLCHFAPSAKGSTRVEEVGCMRRVLIFILSVFF